MLQAVIGIYSYTYSLSNDGHQPSDGSANEFDVAQRAAKERVEQQRRNENAIRQHRAELAMLEARHEDLALRRSLAASQTLERARKEHEEGRAQALKTPTRARMKDDSVRTVDEWRVLAARGAKSRSYTLKQKKAARTRRDKREAQFVSANCNDMI